MKLFLTKDFNEKFLNDKDLSCIIDSYILISDKNSYIKNAYDNETISDLTYTDICEKATPWKNNNSIELIKIIHEPALEYKTSPTGYNFYSWPIKIDVGSKLVQSNKSKKLRCIGLIHSESKSNSLVCIVYFDEDDAGISIGNVAKEINILLSLDEAEIDKNSRTILTESILKNSHNETTDLVRYVSDDTLKLKITNDTSDKEEYYALAITQSENQITDKPADANHNVFNPSGAPLIITKDISTSAKPFISLSDFNNSVIIDNENKLKVFILEEDGIKHNIFSKSITPTAGSIDVFVNTAEHKGEGTDFVLNSNSVSSSITGYNNAEGNFIMNANNANAYADDSTFINVNNLYGFESDFNLGNSIILNSNGCYYYNDESVRSEMKLASYGTIDVSSYNRADYDWGNSNNAVTMIGSNVSSVNINGNNATFFGFSGLVTNKKENSYIIGSFNDPFNDPLMTISTGWYNKILAPWNFNLEDHYVYRLDEAWIKREDLVSVYDNKDIPYTYYVSGEPFSGMIYGATCIRTGNTYITTNEIVAGEQRIGLDEIIDMENIEGDVFEGYDSPYAGTQGKLDGLKSSLNSYAITLTKDDFDNNSYDISLDKLKSLIVNKTGIPFENNVVYLLYVKYLGKENKNNKRYIVDNQGQQKIIQDGEAVTCTRVNIINDILLNV